MDNPDNSPRVDAILKAKQSLPGALLPILHDIQDALGYIPPDAVPSIARALNLSRAEVHGVITYYHYFRQSPPGRHVVRVCRAEACQSVGCEALAAHVQGALACGFHATSADGLVTLEPVYCLGHCAVGPNIQIDETTLHARVTPEKFDQLLASLRSKP
ncbi:formate dehydrogenase [Rugosibacter aromaticivorans]|uniref:Formate dehydrogenase n=1 Tax=Rugosibacter aromaticivorans TaxID=1565605 RepID=A0A0C5JCV6_9PROT|nr:formate dehydrogenase subunit gamma [Rugosibacter aromaticivorans]AJP49604.1 formate dehydrogenase [Rugosibacter aromaticivorans]TBR12783.1 MAG: formate dehydrogenase subunit gamma [Rugosibacter sp.]